MHPTMKSGASSSIGSLAIAHASLTFCQSVASARSTPSHVASASLIVFVISGGRRTLNKSRRCVSSRRVTFNVNVLFRLSFGCDGILVTFFML